MCPTMPSLYVINICCDVLSITPCVFKAIFSVKNDGRGGGHRRVILFRVGPPSAEGQHRLSGPHTVSGASREQEDPGHRRY